MILPCRSGVTKTSVPISKPTPQAKAKNIIRDRWCAASSLFCNNAGLLVQLKSSSILA